MKILDSINSPEDLKKLSVDNLNALSEQIREYVISTVNNCGGHLASNLGCVELTIALHYVFDCPHDSILFDTGHQCYAHKIITGRREEFAALRSSEGVSGFQNSSESICDAYTSGHSGNSISIAAGIARANKLCGENSHVISVIGDGAFTAGLAFEALNDVGSAGDDMIIVLNDNKMSISKNVGAMSKYFNRLRMSKSYPKLKYVFKKALQTVPFVGDRLVRFAEKVKKSLSGMLNDNQLFSNLGIKYYGPFDGHDVKNLIDVFCSLKSKKGPILVHVLTDKGKGYKYAEENPTKFHGVSPKASLCSTSDFSHAFGTSAVNLAKEDSSVVAITSAMTDGTGLSEYARQFPQRFFDVGIAEAHAVAMAAGFARKGIKPIVAVYSSFLQRAFDQIVTDVCIDNLPVIFAVDHSGFVGGDGVTHQGAYDNAYLSLIPNMTVVTPINASHLDALLRYAAALGSPVAVKYPKSYDLSLDSIKFNAPSLGKWDVIRNSGKNALIVVTNASLIPFALEFDKADVAFATFIKPFDTKLIESDKYKTIIVLEDGVQCSGLGERVCAHVSALKTDCAAYTVNHGDRFISEYDFSSCLSASEITKERINKIINNG